MKHIIPHHPTPGAVAQHIFLYACIISTAVITALSLSPQSALAQAKEFRIISRQNTSNSKTAQSLTSNRDVFYQQETRNGKQVYKVQGNGSNAYVDALSNIEYSEQADRIVSFGDIPESHVTSHAYVNIYSGSGNLIKALGLIAVSPFTAALASNGSFIIAGNKAAAVEKPSIYLTSFDKNGNKLWEKKIADENPVSIFTSNENRYLSVLTFKTGGISSYINYYSSSGALLFIDSSHISVSAVEFLPNDKVIVCTGTEWYLHDLKKGYSLLSSGSLQGKTVGRFPVTASASGNMFTVVTEAANGFRVQAINSKSGATIAESVFKGQPYWVPYRMSEIEGNGNILLKTPQETITLKLNN